MTLSEEWFNTISVVFPSFFSIIRGNETLIADCPALIERLDRSILSAEDAKFIKEGKTLITLAKCLVGYQWKQGDGFLIDGARYESVNDKPQTNGSWNSEVTKFSLVKR
jgi:hypothetical protein